MATNAHDEALYLLLRTLDLPLDSAAGVLARNLTPGGAQRVAAMLRRRVVERVPAAYLTREAWLGGHRFYVDERVIIPRSYFVELIPRSCDAGCRRAAVRVADVCTGSGCLAILLAHHFPRGQGRCDRSLGGRARRRRGSMSGRTGSTRRVRLHRSDVFDAVPAAAYDLIVSNPPYEPSALVDRPAGGVPARAAAGARRRPDGLDIIRKLAAPGAQPAEAAGVLLIEVGGLRRGDGPGIRRARAATGCTRRTARTASA